MHVVLLISVKFISHDKAIGLCRYGKGTPWFIDEITVSENKIKSSNDDDRLVNIYR